MFLRFFYIQDFTPQRQDGLKRPVPSVFSRTPCRIPFHQKDFALLRISVGTVGQFAGQTGTGHDGFALYQFTGFACCMTRRSRHDDFVDDVFCVSGVFFQIVFQSLADGLRYSSHDFTVTQFCLCLAFKLRFVDFHRKNGSQAFSEVGRIYVKFQFAQHPALLCIILQRSSKPPTEPCQVCTAFYGVDVVDVRVNVL